MTAQLVQHQEALRACRLCKSMVPPPVTCGPVQSKILLVGQAPGVKEPALQRPFAWTAGKKLFKWFQDAAAITEDQFREHVYMAAVCRCFPGKNPKGGDRVPDSTEIETCSQWLEKEFELLQPQLVLAVGKLAISQFLQFSRLTEVIGTIQRVSRYHQSFDLAPLPHPSGASTWHVTEPGRTLTTKALTLAVEHPVFQAEFGSGQDSAEANTIE